MTSPRRIPGPRAAARRIARCAAVCLAALVLAGTAGCMQKPRAKAMSLYPNFGPRKNLPPYLKGSIYERVELGNNLPFPVSSYGLVTQLRGTGDSTAPSPVRNWMLNTMVKRGFGSRTIGYESVQPESVLSDPNYAIVRVEASLPPGARRGDPIDAYVSALPNNRTASLSHGVLFEAELTQGGANPQAPSAALVIHARCKGPILVNPAYALEYGPGATPTGPAKASLRNGVVMFSGRVAADRPLILQARQPQRSLTRSVENRINERFQKEADRTSKAGGAGMIVAQAMDEGRVEFYVPAAFRGDWEHFAGVVTHLFFNSSAEFAASKAKDLAAEAVKPDAPLMNISYCWEGLGPPAMASVLPLMTHPDPAVAFAAARAAVFIGDPSGAAQDTLTRMAATHDHPFQITSIQVLGKLPPSTQLNQMLRGLLVSDQTLVRIEAYKVLANNGDSSVFSRPVARRGEREKFVLDVVPSDAPPLIYASRRGEPRIAILGRTPSVNLPVVFSAMGGRLSISALPEGKAVTIYHRGERREPVKMLSRPDVSELTARLGGEGATAEAKFDFTYGEVVAVLQAMSDAGKFGARRPDGGQFAAAFVLQEEAMIESEIRSAPSIDAGRPQTDGGGPVGAGPDVAETTTATAR